MAGTLEWEKTEERCAECGEEIDFTDTLVLVEVVRPFSKDGSWEGARDTAPNGTPVFAHHFFHFACWESDEEALHENAEDSHAVRDDKAEFYCDICRSGIRAFELAIQLTHGEIQRSTRAPTGKRSSTFVQHAKPSLMCSYCAETLNADLVELWSDGIIPACQECVRVKCWRDGCLCECHEEIISITGKDS